jgi:hypothetical protein
MVRFSDRGSFDVSVYFMSVEKQMTPVGEGLAPPEALPINAAYREADHLLR